MNDVLGPSIRGWTFSFGMCVGVRVWLVGRTLCATISIDAYTQNICR